MVSNTSSYVIFSPQFRVILIEDDCGLNSCISLIESENCLISLPKSLSISPNLTVADQSQAAANHGQDIRT